MGRPEHVVAWERELERWFAPFLTYLDRAEQRAWAPLYVGGLLGPGERKSIEPIAERVAPGKSQSLHHFISVSPCRSHPGSRPHSKPPWSSKHRAWWAAPGPC